MGIHAHCLFFPYFVFLFFWFPSFFLGIEISRIPKVEVFLIFKRLVFFHIGSPPQIVYSCFSPRLTCGVCVFFFLFEKYKNNKFLFQSTDKTMLNICLKSDISIQHNREDLIGDPTSELRFI